MANITKRTGKNDKVSYLIRVFIGTDTDGKKKFKSMTWKPKEGMTKKQIEKELNRQATLFEEECNSVKSLTKKATFKFIADEWFELVTVTKKLNISTLTRMKKCRERVYDVFGDKYIDEITHRQIQKFVISLAENGVNLKNGKGLSEKTQKHYITFMSDVFRYAIKCDEYGVKINPTKDIDTVKTDKKEKKVYSLDEERKLLTLLEYDGTLMYQLFFHILAFYGLRRGEILGLEWKDFNFSDHSMEIVRTSKYAKEYGIYTDGTKTKGSHRVLCISNSTIELLKRYKQAHDRQRELFGNCWIETDRLFIQPDGKPLFPETPAKWLKRFCKAHDIAYKGLHAFRHSFATTAITSNKVDIKTVSAILGHSQTSTTLNIYTHAVKEANANAINVIADVITGT